MSKNTEKEALIAKIVDAIQDTKGEDIKILDLTKIENSVADYFVICSGNSNTQVSSIAGNVEKKEFLAAPKMLQSTSERKQGKHIKENVHNSPMHKHVG